MPIAGRLTERFGGGRIALVGVSLLALSTIPFVFIGAEHLDRGDLARAGRARRVIGMSFMPAMTAAFTSMRPDQLSDATPQINVLMRIGGAIGTAILAVVLQRAGAGSHSATPASLASAFRAAYWAALGIALLSLIPCLMLLRAERPPAGEPSLRGARRGERRGDGRLGLRAGSPRCLSDEATGSPSGPLAIAAERGVEAL